MMSYDYEQPDVNRSVGFDSSYGALCACCHIRSNSSLFHVDATACNTSSEGVASSCVGKVNIDIKRLLLHSLQLVSQPGLLVG